MKYITYTILLISVLFAQSNFEKRADKVVSQMTLEEKVGEMIHPATGIPGWELIPITGGMNVSMVLHEMELQQFFHKLLGWLPHGIQI